VGRRDLDEMDRRTLVLGGSAVAASAVVGALSAGAAAGLGRAVGGAPSPSSSGTAALPTTPTTSKATPSTAPTTTSPTAPSASSTTVPVPAGTRIGQASQVPVGGAASFQDPSSGDPALILQLTQGQFVAYDAVCPHAGCTVGYAKTAKLIVCPCHGSEFDPTTGAVVSPPAQRGLSPIHVAVSAAGEIYVDG
jgi:thiosulfate dehydrogenase [quinone] large subunit